MLVVCVCRVQSGLPPEFLLPPCWGSTVTLHVPQTTFPNHWLHFLCSGRHQHRWRGSMHEPWCDACDGNRWVWGIMYFLISLYFACTAHEQYCLGNSAEKWSKLTKNFYNELKGHFLFCKCLSRPVFQVLLNKKMTISAILGDVLISVYVVFCKINICFIKICSSVH